MTIREFAKAHDHEIVGKLRRMTITREDYNAAMGEWETVKVSFYVDDAGNEYHDGCIITADGGVI